jgi:hypothetical protein
MPTLKTKSGVTISTLPLPPKGFDPRKASKRDLLRFGFPRPDEPPLRRRWETSLRAPIQVIQPKFRALSGPIDPWPAPFVPDPALAPMRNNAIGGATATATAAQGTIRWIEATWTLPNVYPPPGYDRGIGFGCSTQIGIFGNSDTSLLVGWDIDVWEYNQQRIQSLWWSWAPGEGGVLTNFQVAPGDTLSAVICLDLGSTVRARLYFHNLSSGSITTFIVTAPAGLELTGDTAGWVIHNDIIDFEGPYIAKFGEIYFDECNAGTTDSGTILHPNQPVFLTDFDTGDDVAVANILSDTLLQLVYVGP